MAVLFDIRCSIVPMALRNYEISPLLLSSVLIIQSYSVPMTEMNTIQTIRHPVSYYFMLPS